MHLLLPLFKHNPPSLWEWVQPQNSAGDNVINKERERPFARLRARNHSDPATPGR